MPSLDNPRYERFAQDIAKGMPQLEAYVNAGYKPNDGHAARLAGDGRIVARVAEIKDRAAIRTEITLQSLMEEAAEIQRSALAANQHSAAVAALTAKAKLAGLWVERSENENLNATYVVSSDPVDNVEEWEAEYAQKH
jgi:hypothetical protein